MNGILGIKRGMTRIFDEHGEVVPVTLIQAGPCPIVSIRTKEKDGYDAVQIAYGECKEKNVNMPLTGFFKKGGVKPYRWIKEIKVEKLDGLQIGQEIKIDIFQKDDIIDVSGVTKGKGFAGVMKRHNFAGGPRTHGQSNRQRHPGAIGSQRPQRVKKGTRMAGHMGDALKTVQRLHVVSILPEKNIILVKGSVPGNNNELLLLKKTTRKKRQKIVMQAVSQKPKGKGKPPKEMDKKKK
ncbi:MAG: 50S ribosomal protein L3 [Elusimicrobia bacterium RIFOXYA2_FULL_39_19]|nr:MAG: 50S ribosomal protein L3 [Elusimicrobia bacterium RIFOXYA2_FULL_39_19]